MNIIKLRFNKTKTDLIINLTFEGIVKVKLFDGNKIIHQSNVTDNKIVIHKEVIETFRSNNFKIFIEGDVTEFNDHHVLFKDSLIEIIDINSESLQKLEFKNCYELKSVNITNIPNVTDFDHMFYYCANLKTITNIDTSNGTNFDYMFVFCKELTTIPLFDTSKGTNFSYMFYGCYNLKTIPLFDTSNGKSFSDMFSECYHLTTIPLLDTSNGTNFSYMFCNCYELKTIPLLDTSKGIYFNCMFCNCSNLTTVPLLDTSNGKCFSNMFYCCYNLETISNIDLSNGVSIYGIFNTCKKLESREDIITNKRKVNDLTYNDIVDFFQLSKSGEDNGFEHNSSSYFVIEGKRTEDALVSTESHLTMECRKLQEFTHRFSDEDRTNLSPKELLQYCNRWEYTYNGNNPLEMKEDLFNYLIELNGLKKNDYNFSFYYKYYRESQIKKIDNDFESLWIDITYKSSTIKIKKHFSYNKDEIDFNKVKEDIDKILNLIHTAKELN